jgi:hypothetical protein
MKIGTEYHFLKFQTFGPGRLQLVENEGAFPLLTSSFENRRQTIIQLFHQFLVAAWSFIGEDEP